MSMNRPGRVPSTPTLPQGETVATYATYLEAQHAVDHLADKQFPVQHVTIVGTDLRMVERVTGRLSYPRVALAGLASGMWLGLFVGLMLWFFSTPSAAAPPVLAAVLMGGAFGVLFSVISYALTGGRRDFTSSSQIVAASYSLLCHAEQSYKARQLLQEVGGVQSGWGTAVPSTPPMPVPPSGSPTTGAGTPPTDRPTTPGSPPQAF